MADITAQAPVAVTKTLEVEEPVTNISVATQRVLEQARKTGILKIGTREVIKSLSSGTPHFVFVADDVTEGKIVEVIEGLARQNNIDVVHTPSSEQLGEWSGLYELDVEGNPRKVRKAAAVAVLKVKGKSAALSFLLNHVKEAKVAA